MSKNDWLYKLACIPCNKLKEEVKLKGIENKSVLNLLVIGFLLLFLFRKK
jgi:hypothetical protein